MPFQELLLSKPQRTLSNWEAGKFYRTLRAARLQFGDAEQMIQKLKTLL